MDILPPRSSEVTGHTGRVPRSYFNFGADAGSWRTLIMERNLSSLLRLLKLKKTTLDDRDEAGRTPLLLALEVGFEEGVRLLLDRGADPHVVDMFGNNALRAASAHPTPHIIAELLLASVPPNVDDHSSSALHIAAGAGHVESARVLLQAGALVNCQDIAGLTPLMLASGQGHAEVVELLLSYGAGVELTSVSGDTALHRAVLSCRHDVARVLLSAGANANAVNKRSRKPTAAATDAIMTQLLEHPPAISPAHLWSPRNHPACRSDQRDAVVALLSLWAMLPTDRPNEVEARHEQALVHQLPLELLMHVIGRLVPSVPRVPPATWFTWSSKG